MTRSSIRASASAFANWVFEHTHPNYQPPRPQDAIARAERMRLGTVTHDDIDWFLRHSWTVKHLGAEGCSGWSLWFSDSSDKSPHVFKASKLTVDGEALSCIPDAILYHERTDSFLIIERKTTASQYVPKAGWPNIEAQLWCYSHLDDFEGAPRVYLVAQLWMRINGGLSLYSYHPSWRRGEPAHEARCEAWFKKYGGGVA